MRTIMSENLSWCICMYVPTYVCMYIHVRTYVPVCMCAVVYVESDSV